MSVEAVGYVLRHFPQGGVAKLVMIGIANHAGDGGAWPSVATLAEYACVSDRTVQRALARLEGDGWIVRHPNAGGSHRTDPRHRPTLYELLWTRFPQGVTAGVTPGPFRGDSPVLQGVTAGVTRTVLNHPDKTRARVTHVDQLDAVRRLRREHRLGGAP